MNNVLEDKVYSLTAECQEDFSTIPLDNLNIDALMRQCGTVRSTCTKALRFGHNLSSDIVKIVGQFLPKGLGVIAVTSGDIKDSDIVRSLRKADFRVEVRQVDDGASHEQSLKLKPSDGQRLILGIGSAGTAAMCLYVGGMYSLPVVLIPTSPDILEFLSPYVAIIKGGFKEFFRVPPPVALIVDIDNFAVNYRALPYADSTYNSQKISSERVSNIVANSQNVSSKRVSNIVPNSQNVSSERVSNIVPNSQNVSSERVSNIVANSQKILGERMSNIVAKSQSTSNQRTSNLQPNMTTNFQQNPSDLPSAFGNIMSVFFALFDWRFASKMIGNNCSNYAVMQAKVIILRLLRALEEGVGGVTAVSELVADASLRLSVLMQVTDSARYIHSGATQVDACQYALEKFEQRASRQRGEGRFIWSVILVEVYLRTLAEKRKYAFIPPPDNNRRMDAMKEFFGIDEFVAAKKITPYTSVKTLKLYEYKIYEYRDELVAQLNDIESVLCRAQKIFKRLYDDDGYSLIGYPPREDAALILALAPDFGGEYSYLTYLKQCGILDLYLN